MNETKIVMYESAEAATYRKNIKGWVSSDGHFYGDNEHLARWTGSTHQKCECGNTFAKGRVRCDECDAKLRTEKYYSLPMVEWDRSTPLCVFDGDRYFFSDGDVLDWMNDMRDIADRTKPEVRLVICTPGKLSLVDESNWADDLPEDRELPDGVAQALMALNDAIKAAPVVAWFEGKTRIDVDALWAELESQP